MYIFIHYILYYFLFPVSIYTASFLRRGLMSKSQLDYELERLGMVYKLIERDIEKTGLNAKKSKDEIVEMRRSFWDTIVNSNSEIQNVIDIAQKINQMDMEQASYIRRKETLDRLIRLKNSPYFARVDFKEKGFENTEKIYIGISSFIDFKSGSIYIYDWRSPISSIFYEYEAGPASYISPSGKIEGTIGLKRQFKIIENKIKYMFDSSIKIDDDILQEILSRSADDKMKNIVSSIQKEQNRIIRDENNQLLIVQGSAGSGKTSIALHRIAYILYRYKDSSVTSDNIVIFSPNQMFNDYISNVLPELGEENINQTTFYEYTKRFIEAPLTVEDPSIQIEYILSKHNEPEYNMRVSSIRYKASDDFLFVVKNYLKYIEEEMIQFSDIVYDGELIISKEEIDELFKKDYIMFPIIKRLNKIRDRIYYLLNPKKNRKQQRLQKELQQSKDCNDNPQIAARLQVLNQSKPVMEKIDKMTSFDVLEAYKTLFEDDKLFITLAGKTHIPDDWDDIRKITLNSISNNYILNEDAPGYLFIKNVLLGAPNLSRIKHVVVDEAQDYSPMQYEIFKQLFSSCYITILGDLNQSIHPYMMTKNPERVLEIMDIKNSSIFKLYKSYRSIKEIVEFTKAILPYGERIEYINRRGEKPLVISVPENKTHEELILDDIKKLKDEGLNSIAVICKNHHESVILHSRLLKEIKNRGQDNSINLVSQDSNVFTTGIVVIPSYLSKGLEFDAVIIYDAGENSYSKEEERRLFYTICTRALHKLHIYYSGKLSPFIDELDKNLYTLLRY